MLLAIFRDLVSKNRLFLFLTSLTFALYYHLVGGKFSTSFQVLLISTAIVTALSTFQLLYSYFSTDRVQAYYQLPLSLNRFKGSFLTVTFLLNLLERVLLLILFLGVRLDLLQSFKLVLLSLLVVLGVFYVFIQFNTSRRGAHFCNDCSYSLFFMGPTSVLYDLTVSPPCCLNF